MFRTYVLVLVINFLGWLLKDDTATPSFTGGGGGGGVQPAKPKKTAKPKTDKQKLEVVSWL